MVRSARRRRRRWPMKPRAGGSCTLDSRFDVPLAVVLRGRVIVRGARRPSPETVCRAHASVARGSSARAVDAHPARRARAAFPGYNCVLARRVLRRGQARARMARARGRSCLCSSSSRSFALVSSSRGLMALERVGRPRFVQLLPHGAGREHGRRPLRGLLSDRFALVGGAPRRPEAPAGRLRRHATRVAEARAVGKHEERLGAEGGRFCWTRRAGSGGSGSALRQLRNLHAGAPRRRFAVDVRRREEGARRGYGLRVCWSRCSFSSPRQRPRLRAHRARAPPATGPAVALAGGFEDRIERSRPRAARLQPAVSAGPRPPRGGAPGEARRAATPTLLAAMAEAAAESGLREKSTRDRPPWAWRGRSRFGRGSSALACRGGLLERFLTAPLASRARRPRTPPPSARTGRGTLRRSVRARRLDGRRRLRRLAPPAALDAAAPARRATRGEREHRLRPSTSIFFAALGSKADCRAILVDLRLARAPRRARGRILLMRQAD